MVEDFLKIKESFQFMINEANLPREYEEYKSVIFLVRKFYEYAFGKNVIDSIALICNKDNNPEGQLLIRCDFITTDENAESIINNMTDGKFYVEF